MTVQLIENAEKKTVKVWEVENNIPQVEAQQKRKRQRGRGARDHGAKDPVREMPSQDRVAITAGIINMDQLHIVQ